MLNLNIHLHPLVLDGVFTNHDRAVRFHAVPPLTREEVGQVVALIALLLLPRRSCPLPSSASLPKLKPTTVSSALTNGGRR
jgi:hypothetical protein